MKCEIYEFYGQSMRLAWNNEKCAQCLGQKHRMIIYKIGVGGWTILKCVRNTHGVGMWHKFV